MNYQNKLTDPRWQKRRLEIFERDGWKCSECERKDMELHVHHLKYSNEPWDAPDSDLRTLCALCHFYVHFDYDFNAFRERVRVKYLGTQLIL